MNKRLSNKRFIFFLFILIQIIVLVFNSCSNNVPEIGNAKLAVVFDYESDDSLPKARLSIFVEATSNPRRFDSITVTNNQSEYVWESTDLVLATNNEKNFCGVTNFVMPENEEIPSGTYTVIFHQSDDEKKEIRRTLTYDKTLYETKAVDVPEVMKRAYSAKLLTVYDENKKILYYGTRTSELSDARGIWNNYRDAYEFQESWINVNGTVICNLPIQKVTPGN